MNMTDKAFPDSITMGMIMPPWSSGPGIDVRTVAPAGMIKEAVATTARRCFFMAPSLAISRAFDNVA